LSRKIGDFEDQPVMPVTNNLVTSKRQVFKSINRRRRRRRRE